MSSQVDKNIKNSNNDKFNITINSDPIHYMTHVLSNPFPNIQLKFSTTKEIESITKSLK
jgi:hypothetical protein